MTLRNAVRYVLAVAVDDGLEVMASDTSAMLQ